MQSGIGNTGVWYSAGFTVQANTVFLPNKYAWLGWTHLPASNLLQCLVIWFPCLTLYFFVPCVASFSDQIVFVSYVKG